MLTPLFRNLTLIYVAACLMLAAVLFSWQVRVADQQAQRQLQQYADLLKISLRPLLLQTSAEQLSSHLNELQYSALLPIAALGVYQSDGIQLASTGALTALPSKIDTQGRQYQLLQTEQGRVALQPLMIWSASSGQFDHFKTPDAFLLILPETAESWPPVLLPLSISGLIFTVFFMLTVWLVYLWQQQRNLWLNRLTADDTETCALSRVPSDVQALFDWRVQAEQQQLSLQQQLESAAQQQQLLQQQCTAQQQQSSALTEQADILRQQMSAWLQHCKLLWQRQEQLSVAVFQTLLRLHFLYGLFQFNPRNLKKDPLSLVHWLPQQFNALHKILAQGTSIDWVEGPDNIHFDVLLDEEVLQASLQAMLLLAVRSENTQRILCRVTLEATAQPHLLLHLSCDGNGLPAHITEHISQAKSSSWQWRDVDVALLQLMAKLLQAELQVQSLEGLGSSIRLRFPVALKAVTFNSPVDRLLVFDQDSDRLQGRLAGLASQAVQVSACSHFTELKRKLEQTAPQRLLLFLPAEQPNEAWQQLLSSYQASINIQAFATELTLSHWQAVLPCLASAEFSLMMLQQHAVEVLKSQRHKSLLVVDDNETNQAFINILLQNKPVQLASALTGKQVLQLCLHQQFDMILLDIRLPDMSGIEVAKQLRALPGYQHTPILAFTAHALPAEIAEFKKAGMDDILLKPLEPSKFAALLAHYQLH
ncbi:response regulator [Rheinheimera sp. UJ51]|uniref:response regulator n=1 Tax=Rheinheimera sp. UJ51 TaxID=2892446 RepID=UPI001E51C241|nr:response regulator [Rheinheimera sp. UJ51]MCC5451369.1 response regulator [Rheinheimera sp. UJ51]